MLLLAAPEIPLRRCGRELAPHVFQLNDNG